MSTDSIPLSSKVIVRTFLVGLSLLGVTLSAWLIISRWDHDRMRRVLSRDLQTLVAEIQSLADQRFRELDRLTASWRVEPAPSEDRWRQDAAQLIDRTRWKHIWRTDATSRTLWRVSLDPEEPGDIELESQVARMLPGPPPSSQAPGSSFHWLNLADRLVVVGTLGIEGPGGGHLIGCLPADHLRLSAPGIMFDDYRIQITGTSTAGAPFEALPDLDPETTVEMPLRFRDLEGTLLVTPTGDWVTRTRSSLPDYALATGLVISFLLLIAVHIGFEANSSRRRVERRVSRLRQEIELRRQSEDALKRANERLSQRDEAARGRAQELEDIHEETRQFNSLAVGREMRMVELKRMINELCQELGRPTPFDLSYASSLEALESELTESRS